MRSVATMVQAMVQMASSEGHSAFIAADGSICCMVIIIMAIGQGAGDTNPPLGVEVPQME